MKFNKRRDDRRKGLITYIFGIILFIGMSAGLFCDNNIMEVYATVVEEESDFNANGILGKNSDIDMVLDESVIGVAGESVSLNFTISASDIETIKLKKIFPVVDSSFPFDTSSDAYKVVSAGTDTEKQASMSVNYNMTACSDLETGYHSVRYIIEYSKDKNGNVDDYYVVKTINIYFSGADKETTAEVTKEEVADTAGETAGGFGGSGNVATPKLIITGYTTMPKKVMAGDTFTLTIHIENTSKRTAVKNAKFLIGNEAGSILPTSGSSSLYVENIPAGQTTDLTIEMKTASDLAQKSYIVAVKGDFEDNQNTSYTYSENLYLPIYQEVKLKVTDVSVSPEMLSIGEAGNIMFTINNQGKAGVYNVNVSTKSGAVESEETYLGNIAAAGSAYASLLVTGMEDNSETGTVTIVISYEDSEGKVSTIEEEVDCVVLEDMPMDYTDEFDMDYEEEPSGMGIGKIIFAIVIVLIVIGVITGVVILIILRNKKKKALLEDLEDEDLENEDI